MSGQIENPKSPYKPDIKKSFSYNTLTIIFGAIAALLGVIGIIGLSFGIVFLSGILPEFKPIAVSAALAWIFFGLILAFHAKKPLTGITLTIIKAVSLVIAVTAVLGLFLNLLGWNFFVEDLINGLASQFMSGQVTPISPVATVFIILSGIALFLALGPSRNLPENQRSRNVAGIVGFSIVLMSFTFLLSYSLGAPLLYKTTIIPIALSSALAALFTGLGLVTTAGPSSLPLRYLTAHSIRARLLWSFLPLIVIIVLAQGLLDATIVSVYHVDNAIEISIGIMLFCLITAYIVNNIAGEVGRQIETEEEKRRNAEEALRESEETFRALAENANDGILVAVGTGIHVFANRRAAEITGYGNDELLKLTIRDLSHPDEFRRKIHERYVRKLAGEAELSEYETRIVRKDGKILPIEITSAKTDWRGQAADLVLIRDISARKQAEETLRESELRLRRFYESGLFGAIFWTMDGKITDANDTFLRMVGYSRDDLESGRIDWPSMTPPEFRDLDEKSVKELTSTGFNKTAFEKEYIRKDGTRIPILIAGAMLDEKRSRGIAIVIDITERRKTEDTLRVSEEKYRTLFENMLEGFAYCRMIYDELQRPVDFIYLNVNRSFDRIIGAQTVTGKLVTEVFPGIREAYPQLFEIYGRVALTGQAESFDLDFRPSGKLLHISVYSPQKEYFVAIFEDITEVRRVEAELRESEQRLLLALDVSRMGIWELDLTLHSAHRTLRHDQIFGYQTLLPEWTYEMFLLHVIPEDRKDVDEKFNEAIAKQQVWSFECRIHRSDDIVRWIMALGKGEYDPNGKPVRMLGIVQDITDRKQVEQQQEILINDLEQKNAELERFTYTVSHDLRSPLITIHGFTGLLESDIAGNNATAIAHDLDRINAAATKMEELLHDLLNLSRIGRVVNPPEKISFTVLAQEAVDLLAGVISERKVQVIVDPDMPVVTVDPARVREAIMNLIENAVKFMGDQQYPEIRIGIEYNNNRPVFFVRDNGIGIDQKYFGKLFHLFEKLDAKKEGSGVGLAIVKRIIEVQGGRIWVESGGPGKGSIFRFTLPVL